MSARERSATEADWLAAMDATRVAEIEAQRAIQHAIDARVRELILEARLYEESGKSRAARTAAYKARFVGRTNAREIVRSATDLSIWRRLFGLR